MSSPRIPSFAAFWPFYLGQHAVPLCRHLHFVGTNLGFANLAFAVYTQRWALIPLSFVFGYGFAWVGHFIIEKNRPATFTYPLWSFIGDMRLLGNMWLGKMWTGTPVAPMTEAEAISAVGAAAE